MARSRAVGRGKGSETRGWAVVISVACNAVEPGARPIDLRATTTVHNAEVLYGIRSAKSKYG